MALKGNQGKLSQQGSSWFEQAQAQQWQGIDYDYDQTIESGHHRIEVRQVWTVSVSQLPPLHRQDQWLGLTTVVMVKRRRELWNGTTQLPQFYISSLEANAPRHNQVIRCHWSIENSLQRVARCHLQLRCQSISSGSWGSKSRIIATQRV
ncbi:ISAs1 family transposase [Moorena sp. SIO4A1]|uniref:ISAs1 family transposase n=1 Tax=Moorena sp. SIO4A1 TaxID=2607835 RepID=UPI0025E24585|nr:ISAs1 family transposase [Moorena sp. SIO4A1]